MFTFFVQKCKRASNLSLSPSPGKIMRRVLRKIARNERDLGDISTLADSSVVEQLFDNRCSAAVWPPVLRGGAAPVSLHGSSRQSQAWPLSPATVVLRHQGRNPGGEDHGRGTPPLAASRVELVPRRILVFPVVPPPHLPLVRLLCVHLMKRGVDCSVKVCTVPLLLNQAGWTWL